MSADHSSDPGRQRTVAELLAQYSDESRGGGGRRRRRGAEREPEPVPEEQPGAESWSASVPPAWNGLSGYGEPSTYEPAGSRADPESSAPVPDGSSEWARPGQGRPAGDPMQPRALGGTGSYRSGPYADNAPVNGVYSADSYASPAPVAPAGRTVPPVSAPPAEPRRREDPTEQMPRYAERTDASTARTEAIRTARDTGPSTEISSRAELFSDSDGRETDDDPDDYHDADLDEEPEEPAASTTAAGRRARTGLGGRRADVPAGLAPGDVELEAEPASGWKAWVVLIGQGLAGAVGGALLWVGFRWLWLHLPVVAIAAAGLAIAGLVLIVRTIRGSDDLQTTMLAVLVGLIVTISPAVLLLALH